MKSFYEIKNIFSSDFEGESMIKDVDLKSRTVTGYFSRFGNKDHDGDIMVPGSLTKTIGERLPKGLIPHILDHDIHVTLKQLSKPKLYEKADGGFFESTITDTQNGLDTLKLYRDGVINQHSFGFRIMKDDRKDDARYTKEMVSRYQVLTKAFKDGDYTDETFAILEAQIKQIEIDMAQKYLQSIEKTTEPIIITQPETKRQRDFTIIKELLKK